MKNTIGPVLCLSALLVVAGCSSGGGTTITTTPAANPGASSAYVSNQTPSGTQTDPQILGYSATSSTSAQTSMVNGPLTDTFLGLTTDSSGNLYTVDKSGTNGTYMLNEYAAGTTSSGITASATMRTFTSTAITAAPAAVRVDPSGNVYVMLTGGTVLRFAASSTESVSPTASLSITGGGTIATDSGNNLYVTVPVSATDTHQAIAVYTSGYASGAVAARTILPATEMFITSLAVDASGNIYATGKDANGNIEVAVFAATATGTSTATRVITGANTSLVNPWQVQVDSAGNIFVADSTSGSVGSSVMMYKFAASATGNVAPTLKIASSATYSATSAMTVF
jgi:hypothetical protein